MVLGFMFTPDAKSLVLIQKERPEWQKGLLNGIGGKVEKFDKSYKHALCREFKEEAGVETVSEDWKAFCHLEGKDYELRVFKNFSDKALEVFTNTDEHVIVINLPKALEADSNVIWNLRWLIPMALDINVNELIRIRYE